MVISKELDWSVYITPKTIIMRRRNPDGSYESFELEVKTGLILIDVEKRKVSQPAQVKVIA